MIDKVFVEQLIKNNILNDKSNILDFMLINDFNDNFEISLDEKGNNYGYCYLDISGIGEYLELYYIGIKILNVTKDGFYVVPINFCKNSYLKISGQCKKLKVYIYGASFKNKKSDIVISSKNLIIYGQEKIGVYKYESLTDLINNNFIKIREFDKNSNVQVIKSSVDDNVYIGMVNYLNNLIFRSEYDNFQSMIVVADKCDNCVFVQNKNYDITFIYLKNNKILYKILNSNNILSEEFQLKSYPNKTPVNLISSNTLSNITKFFGVMYNDGSFEIYFIKENNQIDKVYDIIAQNLRIVESDGLVEFILCKDYSVDYLSFEVDENKSTRNILKNNKSRNFKNIIDMMRIGNTYIYTSLTGFKGIIDIDE